MPFGETGRGECVVDRLCCLVHGSASLSCAHDLYSSAIQGKGNTAIGCLGIVATVIALSLFQLGVALCGGVKTSLLSTFEPLTSIVLGILIFREPMTLRIGIGIILILISTVLLVWVKRDV